MMKHVILFGTVIGSAVAVPILYQSNPKAIQAWFHEAPAPQVNAVNFNAQIEPPRSRSTSREAVIPMDARGHFMGDFTFNGRRVNALVDTGATYVAINESTARRIGVSISQSDFKHEVSTANGKTPAAAVVVDAIEIDRVRVRNVPTLVLKDRALKGTLVGMSFLKELDKFTIQDRELLLRQ